MTEPYPIPLTEEERTLVVEAMRKYPPGIHPLAWGSGVMSENYTSSDFPSPSEFETETIQEHG